MDSESRAKQDHAQKALVIDDEGHRKNSNADNVYIFGDAEHSIVLIDNRNFLHQCIRKTLEGIFTLQIISYSTVSEFLQEHRDAWPSLILLSLIEDANQTEEAVKEIPKLASVVPVIVLAGQNDGQLARSVMQQGAKGYIPVTLGFDIAIEAVRFVLAGGTNVPAECLASTTGDVPLRQSFASLSNRELAVVRAIQRGKPNKVIAYELGMCESTVKHSQSDEKSERERPD